MALLGRLGNEYPILLLGYAADKFPGWQLLGRFGNELPIGLFGVGGRSAVVVGLFPELIGGGEFLFLTLSGKLGKDVPISLFGRFEL